MNRYLQDKASRRNSMMRDGRNPYGARGGYVSSRKRSRDRAMDMNYDMNRGYKNRGYDRPMDMEYDYTKYNSGYDSRYDREYGHQDRYTPYERHRESYRPMDYEMYGYGIGGIRPIHGNYMYQDYAHEDMEKEYKEDLHEWIEKLKKKDRFGLTKEQVVDKGRQMGVRYDKFNEMEFYAIYLMLVSDFKQVSNDPHYYLALTKEWLEDDDVEMKGSDKVCAYLYSIVLGEEE